MSKEKFKILLERDSVCAADDCHAPHALILAYDNPPTIREIMTHVFGAGYLANIAGGGVAWVAVGKSPLAVLVQQRETRREIIESQRPIREPFDYIDDFANEPFSFHVFNYLVDENAIYSEYVDNKISVEYHNCISPNEVFEKLKKENQGR